MLERPHVRTHRAAVVVAAVAALVAVLLVAAPRASAATWALQSTPNASGADHTELSDISCEPSSTNVCTAVGRSETRGVGAPYAQHWNGSSWANQTVAVPAGTSDAELAADHCFSTTSCVAAGFYRTALGTYSLVETWNGTSWSTAATPNPVGATETRLAGVSCAVVSACIAVGWSTDGTTRRALAERGNGSSWSLQTMPLPAGATQSELAGVDCRSSTSCVAVGRYNVNTTTYWAWSATWDGTSWTLQTVPRPSGARRSVLLDLACSDTLNCTAVGAYTDAAGVQVTLAQRWDGTAWSLQTTPNPAGSSNTVLQNVSCSGRGTCVAVGDWLDASTWTPMAQAWNGSAWTLEAAPNRTGSTFALLDGVACRITCLAVGFSRDALGTQTTLGARRAAPGWSSQSIASYVANEQQYGVSCTASSACISVGGATDLTLYRFARTFSWNGAAWSLAGNPVPGGTVVHSELGDVSCTAATACVAVGNYQLSGGFAQAYTAHWNGRSWTTHVVPLPARTRNSTLNGVACASATSCVAVGSARSDTTGITQLLIESWNGTSWSVMPTSTLTLDSSTLHGVSCTSPSYCVAAGEAVIAGRTRPMSQHWNGSSWALQVAPLPADAIAAKLRDVACATSTSCVVVGEYQNAALGWSTYSAGFNGTNWIPQTSPMPAFAQSSRLENVACSTAADCVAVGAYVDMTGVTRALASSWDGQGWEFHATPNPGTRATVLLGASCLSPTNCRAVGYERSASDANLAMSYP